MQPTRFQSLVTDSCSVPGVAFVLTPISFLFTRSIRVHSCSSRVYLCFIRTHPRSICFGSWSCSIPVYSCSAGIIYTHVSHTNVLLFYLYPNPHPILTLTKLFQKYANLTCSLDHIEF